MSEIHEEKDHLLNINIALDKEGKLIIDSNLENLTHYNSIDYLLKFLSTPEFYTIAIENMYYNYKDDPVKKQIILEYIKYLKLQKTKDEENTPVQRPLKVFS